MLFNSAAFALFLPAVFVLYWFVFPSPKTQNRLLLAASYFFYAYWDWRFLFLLVFSTLLDFYTGWRIARSVRRKRAWLLLSVCINLGILGFFKYFNFFTGSSLPLLLPLGISFYTFHGLSYVFDIYRGRIKPTSTLDDYALFVGFFPLLIAGPIERATHLLPQVRTPRPFDAARAADGLKQFLWGLFKKMAIADVCAEYADPVFSHIHAYSGSTLVVAAILFAIQIYADFSGYSDMALGIARLFGFDVIRNFSYPYFSRDIAEFWRRWHISLTTWFRDYLYIPLGGSKGSLARTILNVVVVFLISGLWHGANWTFVLWGALNALYFLPLLLLKRNRAHLDTVAASRILPSITEILQIGATFALVVFAWIFFRCDSVGDAFDFVGRIFSPDLFRKPMIFPLRIFILPAVCFLLEWCSRDQPHALANLGRTWPRVLRWSLYYAMALVIFVFGSNGKPFIYFQF